MMDIDDGYILWTGIWKGKLRHRRAPHNSHLFNLALGHSKGKHTYM